MYLSVVIPLYKCEPFVKELSQRLTSSLKKITSEFEILFVNDASPMNDWSEVQKVCSENPHCKGINLSRNFGQHYAITAGLDKASGEWVVVMDGDLQDQPEDIINLYSYAKEKKLDIVWGRRAERKHSFIKRKTSLLFYKLFDYLSGYKSDPSIANFSIINQKVVRAYRQMREQSRAYPMFIRWAGFSQGAINISHAERSAGKSSYNIRRLLTLAFESIIAYSNKPLRIGLGMGLSISFISILFAFYFTIKYFIKGIPVEGFTSMIVSVWFLGGMIMAFLGLIGLYIGKIFDEGKNRPLYFISETINMKEKC